MQLKTSGLLPVLVLSIRMAVIFSISVRRSSRQISDVGVKTTIPTPILTHYCRGEWACWLFIIHSSLFITTSLFSEVVPRFHKHKYAAVQYSERLSGDETFRRRNFANFETLFTKVFSTKLGWGYLAATPATNPWKFSLRKFYTLPISFLPRCFPGMYVLGMVVCRWLDTLVVLHPDYFSLHTRLTSRWPLGVI